MKSRIHRSPVNSPHKGQWRGALMFTLFCARIKGWVNNCEAGDLRRNRAHYDVIVMIKWYRSEIWQASRQRCLPNFRAIGKVLNRISRLRDFTRSYSKTSYRLMNWGPGAIPTGIYCGPRLLLISHCNNMEPSIGTRVRVRVRKFYL